MDYLGPNEVVVIPLNSSEETGVAFQTYYHHRTIFGGELRADRTEETNSLRKRTSSKRALSTKKRSSSFLVIHSHSEPKGVKVYVVGRVDRSGDAENTMYAWNSSEEK
jgi:hypothetical protein